MNNKVFAKGAYGCLLFPYVTCKGGITNNYRFISKIVRNLEGLGENEIPTSTIGKFVMDGLANLDQVAYVRFASVYRNFKEAKDFEQFIGNLNVYKKE